MNNMDVLSILISLIITPSSHSKSLQVMTIYGESEESKKRGRFFNVLFALKNSDSVQLKVFLTLLSVIEPSHGRFLNV